MIKFPICVYDGFYDNPEDIVKYANSLLFTKSNSQGKYPGSRTLPLYELDKKMHEYCCARFMSLYFDLQTSSMDIGIETSFQKVEPFSEDKNSLLNHGWIHTDKEAIAAAVVYLSPNIEPETGTSFYNLIENNTLSDGSNASERIPLYKDNIVSKEYYNSMENYHSNFIETVNVKNYYNRIVAFDSNIWHRGNNYFTQTGTRLTQNFFLYKLRSTSPTVDLRLGKIQKS